MLRSKVTVALFKLVCITLTGIESATIILFSSDIELLILNKFGEINEHWNTLLDV